MSRLERGGGRGVVLWVLTRAGAGTAACTVSGGGASQKVTVTFTAAAATITGLAGTESVSPFDAGFVVDPGSVRCVAWRSGGIPAKTVSLTDNEGTDRTVRVDAGSRVGKVEISIWCWSPGLTEARQTAEFTVVSPDACELPITPGTDPVTGIWTSSCTSSQRGDIQTAYYFKSYTFSLKAAATATIAATAATSTSPRPVIHVLNTTAGARMFPKTGQSGEYELDAGDYKIEVTTSNTDALGSFTLNVSIAAAPSECPAGQVRVPGYVTATDSGCRPVCTESQIRNSAGHCRPAPVGKPSYRFAQAVVTASRAAARAALASRTDDCATRDDSPVTVHQLAALMLAIPIREVGNDPSLMTLSRADGKGVTKGNDRLYSRGTFEDERRAHWNPGVGPWQLDIWEYAINWSHAERADVNRAAPSVADWLIVGVCGTSSAYEEQLGSWYGCKPRTEDGEVGNQCMRVFKEIYDPASDGLLVSVIDRSDPDGGVERHLCRWGTDGQTMPCYLYDMTKAEGTAHNSTVEGNLDGDQGGIPTPLAAAFVSFKDPADGTKYAVFPARVTRYGVTLIRGVPKDQYARTSTLGDGNGWFVDKVGGKALYLETCQPSDDPSSAVQCIWSRQ